MFKFPNFRIRAEKISAVDPGLSPTEFFKKDPQVNTRMLLALGFTYFLGLYEFPLDGRGLVRTRQYVSYNPESDSMIVWNYSRYIITENPSLDQIKKAIAFL